eukprot:1099500-Pleurochrysis_carterae.AAC.2
MKTTQINSAPPTALDILNSVRIIVSTNELDLESYIETIRLLPNALLSSHRRYLPKPNKAVGVELAGAAVRIMGMDQWHDVGCAKLHMKSTALVARKVLLLQSSFREGTLQARKLDAHGDRHPGVHGAARGRRAGHPKQVRLQGRGKEWNPRASR